MKTTIKDLDINSKKVIIRVDFNVPIKEGKIVDNTRIVNSLETIKYALDRANKVILLSHLGRIKTPEDKEKNSLELVAVELGRLLNKEVLFIKDMDFNKIRETVNNSKSNLILLENTRYYDLEGKLESGCDEGLSKEYASLGDIFINDAFGTIHRAHASNVGIARLLPSGIGFLVEKELKELEYLDNPERPYLVVMGGSKVSDKIKVIENIITKCDKLVIGGAMAFTFLKAKGINTGKSLVEDEYLDFCREVLNKYEDKIILPVDTLVSTDIESSSFSNKSINDINNDDIGLDLGYNTINNIKEIIDLSKTVFWNGPLGYYEKEAYFNATKSLLEYLTTKDIKTILGGGDIVACATKLNIEDKIYHISTGGGATLEYLEGKELPGLEIIKNK